MEEVGLKETICDELADQFEALGKVSKGSDEAEKITKDICSLVQVLDKLEQTEIDAYDKEERRKADKEKNQQMHDLEVKKSKLSWDRVLFEFGKIIIPGLIGWGFYAANQEKLLKYEETGRLTTDAARQGVRLPNPFSFFKK